MSLAGVEAAPSAQSGRRFQLGDLAQVFLFVETVNAAASAEVFGALARREETFRVGRNRLRALILELGGALMRAGARWPGGSEVLAAARESGLRLPPDPRVIGATVQLLLRPARLQPLAAGPGAVGEGAHGWRLAGPEAMFLPRPMPPDEILEHLHVYQNDGERLYANRHVLRLAPAAHRRLPVCYWQEPFDAIGVARLFISEVMGEAGRAADHYLQQWLLAEFGLSYDERMKVILAELCRSLNRLFFGSNHAELQRIHTHRSSTVSLSLLLAETVNLLAHGGDPDARGTARRRAFGLFLFLRACRQLRAGYAWLGPEHVDSEDDEKTAEILRSLSGRLLVSAFRPLGNTYLQTRVFGMMSFIPGLSNIFRGGFLPRVERGRTLSLVGPPGAGKTVLALQMLADVARCQGAAIYISLEEDYGSIFDRLVSFALLDTTKMDVVQGTAELKKLHNASGRGVLVLYTGNPKSTSILEAIDRLGSAVKERFATRALVLDSINALEIETPNTGSPAVEDQERRIVLQELIHGIEKQGFFGIILGERDDRSLWSLPYLTDTVIDLGRAEGPNNRWLEIKKCRVQDYHGGRHALRLHEGAGALIYPSLAARRSSLRGRPRSTISGQRSIPLPAAWQAAFGLEGIQEKSSTLVWGSQRSGKSLLLFNLVTRPSQPIGGGRRHPAAMDLPDAAPEPPANILLVTFRTPERDLLRRLQGLPDLLAAWQRVPWRHLRWYSPGLDLGAEQIVAEIWSYINASRREGRPVERVVFDETEMAEVFLPALREEPLFWPTLFELTATEAITSFYVCGSAGHEPPLMELLRSSMDYVFHVFDGAGGTAAAGRRVALENHPHLLPGHATSSTPFSISPGGLIDPLPPRRKRQGGGTDSPPLARP